MQGSVLVAENCKSDQRTLILMSCSCRLEQEMTTQEPH